MTAIDKLLEKMEQRGVQQIVIVNDQAMRLLSGGREAVGPVVSSQWIQETLNEFVPLPLLAHLNDRGQCQFPYSSPHGFFNINCERGKGTLKVSIAAAPPSTQSQTHSSGGLGFPSPVPATMPSLAPADQESAASASSHRWFGSSGAIALLVVGALIGAAVVMPNFVSFSKPTSPKEDPPVVVPTPNVKAPAVSPATPQPPILSPSQPQSAQGQPTPPQPAVAPVISQQPSPQQPAPQSDAGDYQLPMKKTDSVPQIIADISADIQAANTPARAGQIAFACHHIEAALRDQARNNVKDVDISSNWAMAMGHLAAAAEAKEALLSNPPSYDVQRFTMNLNAELFNAKNSGQAAQQFIDEKNNPELARQDRERFRQRTDDYEQYNRDVASGNSR